jgi:antitoxin (DNA-binding transcriptional repressor) of toxin-antitoxin stability system
MNIRELNANISGRLEDVVASGRPEPVTRHRRPVVTIVPTALWTELVAAAGDDGRAVLEKFETAAAAARVLTGRPVEGAVA